MPLLYRGENKEMFESHRRKLVQKLQGTLETSLNRRGRTIEHPPDGSGRGGQTMPWNRSGCGHGSGAKRTPDVTNTILDHEAFQETTPGVSTTPRLDRAKLYAKHNGAEGRVFVIDRDRLANSGVRELVVAQHVPCPRIPEDDEVLLWYSASEILPDEIIVKILEV